MNVVAEGFGTCGLDRIDPVSQHGAEDVDHLPVAAGLVFQFAPHASDRHRQLPLLERCPVAKGTRFASQNGYVMQGVKDGFIPPKGTLVLADNPAILPAFQPVGVGPDLHRPPDRPGID